MATKPKPLLRPFETVFPELDSSFGEAPRETGEQALARADEGERATAEFDALFAKLFSDGKEEDVLLVKSAADPLQIFATAAEPPVRQLAKRAGSKSDTDGGVNRAQGYGWRFETDPETGEEVVKGFVL
jgi:hypothetical protein